MKKYFFRTTATMKYYNNKNWWIDRDIIRDIYINAENVAAAIEQYKKIACDTYGINISNNALKNKDPMYIDTDAGAVQTGYVITASCDFNDDINYKWIKQYIDLWVNISIIENAFQEAQQ